MSKKFIWLYGFYVSWSMILLSRIKFERWDYIKSILIFIPLCTVFFVLYRKREMAKDQKSRISTVAISIVILLLYCFLGYIGGGRYPFLLVIFALSGVTSMSIMMLGSLSYHSKDGVEWKDGIYMMLHIIAIFCLLKSISLLFLERYIYLFDGIMIFIIIVNYFRCFLFKNENEESVGENHIENGQKKKKASRKLYINIGVLIFLFLSGYLFFLGELNEMGEGKGLHADIAFLLASVLGILLTWIAIKMNEYLFFAAVGLVAVIMLFSCSNLVLENEVKWIMLLLIQMMYILLICIFGGLTLRIVFLYSRTYEDLLYFILGMGFPVWVGSILVNELLKKEVAGFVGMVIFPLIGIVFYIFQKEKIITKDVKGNSN